jgi:FOG: Transposase and inactivated derivatives
MDMFDYKSDAFYIFDKAYVKLASLSRIDSLGGFYVVRRKKKMRYDVLETYNSNEKETGILLDLKIVLSNRWAKNIYKAPLRIVHYYSKEKNCVLEFFTNNFDLDAQKIAYLYKCRWQIELFFKWIKQHLRIKRFYGFTENAVKIQIYTCITAYCLVALIGTELKTKMSPFELLRILSVSLFEKTNLREFITGISTSADLQIDSFEMLKLF